MAIFEISNGLIIIFESAKNGRIGAHGLNSKIYTKSELKFEIKDKKYPRKKIMSLQHF